MIKVTLTNEAGVMRELGNGPRMVKSAINSAILKTAKIVEKRLEDESSRQFDIPRIVLSRWRIKSTRLDKSTALVWWGYNPIKAGYVARMTPKSNGSARQEDWGVRVRSYLFKGAHIATMPNGKRGIWKRGTLTQEKVSILKAPILSARIKAQVSGIYAEVLRGEVESRLNR